ncbi:MAG: 7-cyano-7-deazaguanine synthase [Candidatus Omnitrophica bacterium]|nr:7-cyano-7-deazaguanine synthase [Candidatus Omnitrophota bacterium]
MDPMQEIRLKKTNIDKFIKEKCANISAIIGKGKAINALSGGVDSAAVTMLGHKAIGKKLKTYFIDNGLMRRDEAKKVKGIFKKLGVEVSVIDAKNTFLSALRGIDDPELKREAISQTFYKDVFGKLVRNSEARFLLQGTILTDIDETRAGIKRQHNVFEQLGIDPEKNFGYKILEPLACLRKDSVRYLAKSLGLPEDIYDRPPFPGPALAARIIGEVTDEKIKLAREATDILEQECKGVKAFQYMAILHKDRVTGIRYGKRDFGRQIEIRCWDSKDAREAKPTNLPFKILRKIADRITSEVGGIVSVTYNITTKPPSTIEAV